MTSQHYKNIDEHTPVLVGIAAVNQRFETAGEGKEAYQLMVDALEAAASDAGSRELLTGADEIQVPKGTWSYTNPAQLLADEIGAEHAQKVLVEIGVLQQTLFSRACKQIADGSCDIVLIAGGESKYRNLRAAIAGLELDDVAEQAVAPDVTLSPASELRSQVERDAGLGMPVGDYAMIDSALRYHQGLSVDEHRDQIAELYQGFSRIAQSNPDAWNRQPVDAAFIRDASAKNKMLAYPYTKWHNSQWNVDQASALIFCSVGKARELGIDEARWVFPLASTESNFMSMVAARKPLYRCPGFYHAGKQALALSNKTAEHIDFMELYSCFPSAVRMQLAEMGLDASKDLSVTGAMTFGGGPLNNFVLQATVKMAEKLRAHPGKTGMVTCVSGMLTKQGVGIWSTSPNAQGFQFADVSAEVAEDCQLSELVGDYQGPATVVGYTVLYSGDQPARGIAIADLPNGSRTVVFSENTETLATMLAAEFCGADIKVSGSQFN
jgi:acetyl-CoA C-acetyltransferase